MDRRAARWASRSQQRGDDT